jgi:hypothetical protein
MPTPNEIALCETVFCPCSCKNHKKASTMVDRKKSIAGQKRKKKLLESVLQK